MTPEEKTKEVMDVVISDIVESLRDETFAVEGTPTVTVKKADNTFRTKPLLPGQEFFMTGGYIGARNKLYLIFTPVDAQEYIHIESEPKKIDAFFPDFGFRLGAQLGAQFKVGEEAADLVISEVTKMTARRLADDKIRKEEAEKAAKKTTYEDNPLFGMF